MRASCSGELRSMNYADEGMSTSGMLNQVLALGELLEDLKTKLDEWNGKRGSEALAIRSLYFDEGVFVGDHVLLNKVLTYFNGDLGKSYGLHRALKSANFGGQLRRVSMFTHSIHLLKMGSSNHWLGLHGCLKRRLGTKMQFEPWC